MMLQFQFWEQAPNYRQPLELLDTMDMEESKNIIFKAVRKNTITLMTRRHGRETGMHGKEFFCLT
jgi:hypothetical protein